MKWSVDIVVSCSSSTSNINALPSSSTSSRNSNGFSSREANAIYIVLGEISPLLQKKYTEGCKRKSQMLQLILKMIC